MLNNKIDNVHLYGGFIKFSFQDSWTSNHCQLEENISFESLWVSQEPVPFSPLLLIEWETIKHGIYINR